MNTYNNLSAFYTSRLKACLKITLYFCFLSSNVYATTSTFTKITDLPDSEYHFTYSKDGQTALAYKEINTQLSGGLWRSTDAGIHWSKIRGDQNWYISIEFEGRDQVNALAIRVDGANMYLEHTSDAGSTWYSIDDSTCPLNNGLSHLASTKRSDGSMIFVTNYGLFITYDNGHTCNELHAPNEPQFLDVATAGGTIIGYNSKEQLVYSDDVGKTWHSSLITFPDTPLTHDGVFNITFKPNTARIYASMFSYKDPQLKEYVWLSDDGAQTFKPTKFNDIIRDLVFTKNNDLVYYTRSDKGLWKMDGKLNQQTIQPSALNNMVCGGECQKETMQIVNFNYNSNKGIVEVKTGSFPYYTYSYYQMTMEQ
ncbi:hypothetical protein D5R81_15905 [Parashewanella spongiae]|uniref:Photosynthesis system II assembly factor Ycf48/Hcf136-like domain-containing protein n=1 Tax=Parashewanella spongiae TaxID=342950 RepID=A0A3A6THS0_9GAMM|nr:hypothetical protein [Parashewanella spongiae]MCL1079528.1 hypothetical protein [Parashewanella spongiae]RJY07406.1 hypothetical protein D5R81_15905 [Parashewanella spongiae]